VDTFELLPTLAQGELSETSAPELVAAAFRSRASGTLWVETPGKVELRVYFRAGDMCGAAHSEAFHTLAHVLLANDWVSALEIDSTRDEAVSERKRHGEVLVAKGLLTPEQLRAALRAQHSSNLNTLLAQGAGSYDWRGWEPPPIWAREVADPGMCFVTALESEKHEKRRRKVLDWLGLHSARLSPDWPELQQRLALEAAEEKAAGLLKLPRKLSELVQASKLSQARAEALLVTLLLTGAVEPQPEEAPVRAPPPLPALTPPPPLAPRMTPTSQPRVPPPATSPRVTPANVAPAGIRPSPPPPAPPPRVTPSSVAPAAKPGRLTADDLLDMVLEPLPEEAPLLRPMPARALEDDLLTPLPTQAGEFPEPTLQASEHDLLPPLELDTTPRGNAREARQDQAMAQLDALLQDDTATDEPPLEIDTNRSPVAHGGSFDAQGEAQQDSSAKELRKKLLARGLRNLGGSPGASGERVEEPVLPSAPAQPQAAKKMTDEERRFADDATDRLRRAPAQTAYARLGVSPNASQEAIKAAYLSAAKLFHPDRASGGLASMQGDLQQLFGFLKEAYESLSVKEVRERYDLAQRTGTSSSGNGPRRSSQKDEAILAVKMGEVLLKKRDFEAAIAKLRRAVELDASGDALAALAWALVADPKATPATKEEAATLINKALRAEGVTGRTFYVAGVLWRTKDPDSAMDAFRKALELEPKNADAALELRLIEQRRGKQQKAGGGVLSGLLFGKRKG
jgi:curved DNA-binding protein CbpA